MLLARSGIPAIAIAATIGSVLLAEETAPESCRIIRDKGNATYAGVLDIAREAASGDTTGYRDEFLNIVGRAKELSGR